MPTIYIIAGPPGIGKSTNGSDFIMNYAGEILNHDKLTRYYKNKGRINYEDLSNLKANDFIREQFLLNLDFGIELNLGFESHYDFIRYVRKNHSNYLINVILFFTDDVQLCIDRATYRQQSGGHIVEPHVIKEMYAHTIPLLRSNIGLVNQLQFIHVNSHTVEMVYEGYYPIQKCDFINTKLPEWITQNFIEIINHE
jgi:predicted ABC-type ATPase